MFRYLLKNILNYGKSYVIIFSLIIIMTCVLSLFIALGQAYANHAVKYSRSEGDLRIIRPDARSQADFITPESELMEFTKNILQAEKIIGMQGETGRFFSETFSYGLDVIPLDIIQEFDNFKLVEGSFPNDYEVLVSDNFAEDNEIAVGDPATFVYNNEDNIIDSTVVTISGIFTMYDRYYTIVPNKNTFSNFFGKKDSMSLNIFLSAEQRGAENALLSDQQFTEFYDAFTKEFGDNDDVDLLHFSKDYYDQVQMYLFFFYFLLLIIIGILSLLAVITIMNVTHTIFTNRLPDVGVFFTFGFSVKKIAVLFSFELLCLFLLATSIGLGISLGLSQYISTLVIRSTNFTLKILLADKSGLTFLYDGTTYGLTILCCVILPFIFSYIYMRKKSRLSVMTFLRNV